MTVKYCREFKIQTGAAIRQVKENVLRVKKNKKHALGIPNVLTDAHMAGSCVKGVLCMSL